MNDVFERNTATNVKMELCFDGKLRLPLYFGIVRVYIKEGRNKLTYTLRMWIIPVEGPQLRQLEHATQTVDIK